MSADVLEEVIAAWRELAEAEVERAHAVRAAGAVLLRERNEAEVALATAHAALGARERDWRRRAAL